MFLILFSYRIFKIIINHLCANLYLFDNQHHYLWQRNCRTRNSGESRTGGDGRQKNFIEAVRRADGARCRARQRERRNRAKSQSGFGTKNAKKIYCQTISECLRKFIVQQYKNSLGNLLYNDTQTVPKIYRITISSHTLGMQSAKIISFFTAECSVFRERNSIFACLPIQS